MTDGQGERWADRARIERSDAEFFREDARACGPTRGEDFAHNTLLAQLAETRATILEVGAILYERIEQP